MGGAGKTPTAITLAQYLLKKSFTPHVLSRGYGGSIKTSTAVLPNEHGASQVGDEPLLLARIAPTWVGKDRFASGQMAQASGADILLLDDGLQNPTLHKDISILVMDGKQGIGNGYIFPAGPLREDLGRSLAKVDAVVFIGADVHHIIPLLTKPVIRATIQYNNPSPKKVLAFCGLGFPDKFYDSLRTLGYEIADQQSFEDHHPYSHTEIQQLLRRAEKQNIKLITTEKDLLKIPHKYHEYIEILEMHLQFENTKILDHLLKAVK